MTIGTISTTQAGKAAPSVAEPSVAEPWPRPRQAWYAVFAFALALMINFLDRGIITLLVPSIKADLALSDFQMSLVMGFAFVFFYVFLGLPIARLADVGTRRAIVGVGIALWSAATALCGLAGNFWQLFLFRIGTGVGEACNGPATFSMMSDLFPPEKLPRALAVLNFGFMAGNGFALIIGGAVIHFLANIPAVHVPLIGVLKSWQLTFMLVGLPGMLVAAMMWTVKEPVRRGRLMASSSAGSRPAAVPIGTVVRFVIDNRATYAPMLLGLAFNTVLAFGSMAWAPAFFGRTFGWSMTEVGLVSGVVFLTVWPLGAMFGSWLSEYFQARGHDDANLRVVVIAVALSVPGMVAFPLMPSAAGAVAVSALNGFIAAWVLGPQNAALQVVTPNEMRGQITALALFIFNVVGFGMGPTVVAVFTDYVFGSEADLRYALSSVALILSPMAAGSIWWGLKAYGKVLRARELELKIMKDVEGKVAFVTGGASGIGLGMAHAFAGAGMKVVLADLRQDHLDRAVNTFGAGASVHPIKLDVTDRAAMARAAVETEKVFGKLHLLCNNAGIGLAGPAKFATYDDWDWAMGVNLGGVINGVVTFVPRILAHGEGGHIVNTASMSGILPHPGACMYTTAKAAVIGMSEVLRSELAADNIGVSAFCPGPVQTNIAKSGETRRPIFPIPVMPNSTSAARRIRIQNAIWTRMR